jgi:predicted DNA-binding protein
MMGKFKRQKPEARDEMVSFRASPSEIEFLRELAKVRGLSLANMLREAIDAYVKKHAKEKP